MSANDKQIGGDHYATTEGLQHWDFVWDVSLGYHAGCASKYICRAYKKNGLEDLEKALHYIDKCEELGVRPVSYRRNVVADFARHNSLDPDQFSAILALLGADWKAARIWTKAIISRLEEPTKPQV